MSYSSDFIPYNYFAPFGPGFRQFPPGPPPFGFPGGGNIGPGPGNNEAPPMGPPPSFTPSKVETKGGVNVKAVDPGSIKFCKYKYTYLWLTNGNSFWSYITYVGKKSISGFRWIRYRWVYFGIDLRQIDSFICY
ncbi:hypothetical protein [Clostridium botulinum]|uniref:hypothetical protein n=1 Tax=Clostridium botulinum TaxID=1491 RepID=UPI00069B26A1|nr:hypothetical protein [Clostridium botulinum]KOA92878.1 hypothetical protein ADU76_07840 [Clostridium botulinum]MCD3201776.1 hypothetical protein [Clostridium botulinum C/D]MCD3221331.1 hypothetical protein [Clostridium botulinum C/D]MCD3230007.1 hypothetical protein [Clostridium botulinum C/D]MCD3272104.1 hypothetical protein [Clostridium botulinum C/D]